MKQLIYICCILGLTACNSNKQQQSQEVTPTPTGMQGIQAPGSANSTATSEANSSSGALNPAHGMPGHRCELPVGAPLNSAPAPASTTKAVAPAQPAAQTTNTPSVNEKGKKLNPAHGMPGHSCAIAEGAPLN